MILFDHVDKKPIALEMSNVGQQPRAETEKDRIIFDF
jgi:hypothetical protein